VTATTGVDAIREDLEKGLPKLLGGGEIEVLSMGLMAGGASKEAWSVDVAKDGETLELLLRRATGGAIFTQMLSVSEEYRVLDAAFRAGVTVPRPYGYLDDVAGKDAFLMARVKGETIGRRIVRKPEFAHARQLLPRQMAQEIARIHSIALDQVPFVAGPREQPSTPAVVDALEEMLDGLPEPHPAIELGLRWLRDHTPTEHGLVLIHADFRLGNFMVDDHGIAAVLDWEGARRGDPAEDLSWALLRAWRFGVDEKRLAGVGEVEPYLDRYNELTGREITMDDLFYWELAGNVRWALGSVRQGLRHTSGEEPSVELAVIGRLASEVEYELLDMLEGAG
jgi:aminoglycoside phosphotransferase (APT) family kinase protein